MNNINFWWAAQKAELAGCTTGQASELHIKAGCGKACQTALLWSTQIHVFHLETQPAGPPISVIQVNIKDTP